MSVSPYEYSDIHLNLPPMGYAPGYSSVHDQLKAAYEAPNAGLTNEAGYANQLAQNALQTTVTPAAAAQVPHASWAQGAFADTAQAGLQQAAMPSLAVSPGARAFNYDVQGYQASLADAARANQAGADAQKSAIQQYQDVLAGTGPSLAQSQLQQATDANVKQQMGLAASLGGRNAGNAIYQAKNNAAAVQQQAANQSAQLRAQEVAEARQGLTSTGAALQGEAQDEAQLQQQASQFNASNQQQANQAYLQAATQAGLQNAANQQQASQFNAATGADLSKYNVGLAANQGQFNAQLAAQLGMFNAGQGNQMNQFNASNQMGLSEFNAGQSAATNQMNAQLQQQASVANLNAALQNQGQQYGFATGMLGLQGQLNQQAANNLQNEQQLKNAGYYAAQGLSFQQQQAQQAEFDKYLGMGLSAVGGFLAI